ncbi:MAG: hypothetical protein JNL34_16750 [Anaerolineae bacterium]|nr:hypothetical protein [Anaerolineae bacterium]
MRRPFRLLLASGALLALAACGGGLTSSGGYPDVRILADVLTPTAGPPAVIGDVWATTESFAVRHLPGWTVETAPAGRAPAIAYRQSPCTAIIIAPYPYPAPIPEICENLDLRVAERGLRLNGQTILVLAIAPIEEWASVEPAFAEATRSVRAP